MWIAELSVDLIGCVLICATTSDPDRGTVEGRLHFRAVGHVHVDRYHDPNEDCFGDVEAFESTPLGNGRARFRLYTGDAVVTFEADEPEEGPLLDLLRR